MREKGKICAVTTISMTMEIFMIEALKELKTGGYDISLVSNMKPDFYDKNSQLFNCINVPMARGLNPLNLIKITWRLYKIFHKEKYDFVQYATPNAAFAASVAARLAGIKKRVYCQWGIRYVAESGLKRKFLKAFEKFTCSNSTHIRPASFKNMQFAIDENLYQGQKASVIGKGGTVGVDFEEFDYKKKEDYRRQLVQRYPILKNKLIFCFVGRINKNKGIRELLNAFNQLSEDHKNVALLIIGPEDEKDIIEVVEAKQNSQIVFTGFSKEIPLFIGGSDIFVLPTYREGFSMVIQEAMAMKVPVITTEVPGPSEVIEDKLSGWLVPSQDWESLYKIMKEIISDPSLIEEYGENGYKRASQYFKRETMLKLTYEDRINILSE